MEVNGVLWVDRAVFFPMEDEEGREGLVGCEERNHVRLVDCHLCLGQREIAEPRIVGDSGRGGLTEMRAAGVAEEI